MPALEDHPIAAIFPLMSASELDLLAADIESNGLRDPIWILEGQILDGRNRYRACVLRDIDHRVEHYKGKDPIGFVLSKNLHRRHLTESQRAIVAARFANLQIVRMPIRESVVAAAAAMNVSLRTVDMAREVVTTGVPELLAAVEAGEVSVSAAALVTELPPAEQRKVVADGDVAAAAKAIRIKKTTVPQPSNTTSQETKPAESNPDLDEEPVVGGVEVSSASAEKCMAVCTSIIKTLHRSRDMLSSLMASPFAEILRNVSQSVTGCELYATGETVKKGELHGVYNFGWPEWSAPALDELLRLGGVMKLALARAEEIAAETAGEQMTSEEVADFGESLRGADHKIPI